MLNVSGLTKSYGTKTVLRNVNLSFSNGVYALLAPNGAGKTTLIKLLVTLLSPDAGIIEYNESSIYALNEAYRDKIGYLPQDFEAYRSLSATAYMRYIAECKGLTREQMKERIPALLSLVSLADTGRKTIGHFSGGMKRRLGIAQALLNEPEILILDEPTAGLDPQECLRIRNYLSQISKDRTVIISTHILSDIEWIANRVIMLKAGTVLYNDTRENLCRVLEGKVYSVAAEPSALPPEVFVTAQRQEQEGMVVRCIYEGNAEDLPGAMSCAPSLEDLFLYTYRDGTV